MARKKFQSKASQFLYNRYIAGDLKREEEYEEEVINAEIARKIYERRIINSLRDGVVVVSTSLT